MLNMMLNKYLLSPYYILGICVVSGKMEQLGNRTVVGNALTKFFHK